MNPTFETIGLEVPSERAFNHLAEKAGDQGEPTRLMRRGAVLHGRCWKLGNGLEVWTVLYESGTGDVFYADCRPGFRARYTQRIGPWALTEYDGSLAGKVVAFKPLRNPISGTDLFWIYLDLGKLRVEILVNRRVLKGGPLAVGATVSAEVWLQGHVLDERALRLRYEGVDRN